MRHVRQYSGHPNFYFVFNDGKLGRWLSNRLSVLSPAALPLHINPRIPIEAVHNIKVSGFPPCNVAECRAFEFVRVEIKKLTEKERGGQSSPAKGEENGGTATQKSKLSY